jgi:hypothetical protein
MYFPNIAGPTLGLLRAYVRDESDVYHGEPSIFFIDSDGQVVNANATLPPGSGNPRHSSRRSPNINVLDGNWHMLTLTTIDGSAKGFKCVEVQPAV